MWPVFSKYSKWLQNTDDFHISSFTWVQSIVWLRETFNLFLDFGLPCIAVYWRFWIDYKTWRVGNLHRIVHFYHYGLENLFAVTFGSWKLFRQELTIADRSDRFLRTRIRVVFPDVGQFTRFGLSRISRAATKKFCRPANQVPTVQSTDSARFLYRFRPA